MDFRYSDSHVIQNEGAARRPKAQKAVVPTHPVHKDFNTKTNSKVPGITGEKPSQIQLPAKTVLCGEAHAFVVFSRHFRMSQLLFNRAQNELAFADGDVSLTDIYWNGSLQETGSTYYFDPLSGFNYQWSNRK